MIKEVRYIPSLKRNLVSFGELEKKGYVFKGEKGLVKVLRGSMVVIKGVRKNDMYALDGVVIVGSTSTIESTVYYKTELWHKRLSHVSENGLMELDKQCWFGSDRIDHLGLCEHYIQGKAYRIHFNMGQ